MAKKKSSKIDLSTDELTTIRNILLQFNTSVQNANVVLQIVGKINKILEEQNELEQPKD